MTSTESSTHSGRPERRLRFRLGDLFLWVAAVAVWVPLLKVNVAVAICIGILILALFNDRHLTNVWRVAIVVAMVWFLAWYFMPTVD